MRKTAVVAVLIALLVAAYYGCPFYGLHQISRAVQRRDAAELAQRIDVSSLRRSLGDQIGRAYLRVTGKDKGLNEFQIAMAARVATALAEPQINEILRPENLIALLNEGGATAYAGTGLSAPRLEGPNFKNLFRVWGNTERFGRDFSIILPISADAKTGYRVELCLEDWIWKLSGLGLPEAVQVSIANEIVKSQSK